MTRTLKSLVILLLAAMSINAKDALAQNVRYDYIAMTTTGSGQAVPMLALPGAAITFYSCTDGNCSTLAATYNTANSTTACPSNAQVVLALSTSCTSTADFQGNFGAWFQPGQYAYSMLINGQRYGPYPFTVGGSGGGGGNPNVAGSVQYANAEATSFQTGGLYNTEVFNDDNNGVAQFEDTGACSGLGCYGMIPATSGSTEVVPDSVTVDGTHITDYRSGAAHDYYYNVGSTSNVGYSMESVACMQNFHPSAEVPIVQGQCLNVEQNQSGTGYYQSGSPSSAGMFVFSQQVASSGIKQVQSGQQFAYGAGDDGFAYWYQFARSSELAGNDEGALMHSMEGAEVNPPVGVVGVGGANATVITPNWTANGFVTADGFTTLSTNEIFSSGTMTATTEVTPNTNPLLNSVTTSDTHATSTGYGFLTEACAPPVTPRDTPIPTSCSFTTAGGGFGTFTVSSSSPVCIADFTNPEVVAITANTGGALTLEITLPHPSGAPIYQGGPCGSYLVPGYGTTHPSVNVARPPAYPIMGAKTATSLDYINYYKQGEAGNIPLAIPNYLQSNGGVPAYVIPILSMSRTGSTVTLLTTSNAAYLNNYTPPTGASVCVSGNSDSSFNACGLSGFAVTNDGQTITYTQTGAATTGTGGQIFINNLNNYEAIEGAETVGILGSTDSNTAGTQMELRANAALWATGSPIIQLNNYAGDYSGGRNTYTAETPNTHYQSLLYSFNMAGEYFSNGIAIVSNASEPITKYVGGGGNFLGHEFANLNDWYQNVFEIAQPPINGGAIIKVDNVMPNSVFDYYDLFNLAGSQMQYFPSTHMIQWFGNFTTSGTGTFGSTLQANSLQLSNGFSTNEINGENPDYLWGGDGPLTPGDLPFVNNTFSAQDSGLQIDNLPVFVANISSTTTSPNSETITGLGSPTFCFGVPTNAAGIGIPVYITFSGTTLSANYTVLTGGGTYAVFCTYPTPASVH